MSNQDPQPGTPEPSTRRPTESSARARLLDLAHDASSYLRHNRSAAVRASAAVLLAASLAACSPDESESGEELDVVQPLAQEVREGLPLTPGRYPIAPGSLSRDSQGIYSLAWGQGASSTGWQQSRVSLAQLAQGTTDELEIPAVGDPILHLNPATAIPLVDAPLLAGMAGGEPTPTPGTGSSGGSSHGSRSHVYWFPFGGGFGGSSGPAYRNPPSQTVSNDGSVVGSTSTQARPAPADRISGLSHGVSGQAGGTGTGTAATLKSGAEASRSRVGAATAKSSGFSGGKSGFSFGSGG